MKSNLSHFWGRDTQQLVKLAFLTMFDHPSQNLQATGDIVMCGDAYYSCYTCMLPTIYSVLQTILRWLFDGSFLLVCLDLCVSMCL